MFGAGGDAAVGVSIGFDPGAAADAEFLEFSLLTQPPAPCPPIP